MRVLDMEVLVEEGSCQAHREVYIFMDIRAGLNTKVYRTYSWFTRLTRMSLVLCSNIC